MGKLLPPPTLALELTGLVSHEQSCEATVVVAAVAVVLAVAIGVVVLDDAGTTVVLEVVGAAVVLELVGEAVVLELVGAPEVVGGGVVLDEVVGAGESTQILESKNRS